MAATNDITGDRLTSKIAKDNELYGENLEKIFGKKRQTNGGWKYEPETDRSVIDVQDKVDS